MATKKKPAKKAAKKPAKKVAAKEAVKKVAKKAAPKKEARPESRFHEAHDAERRARVDRRKLADAADRGGQADVGLHQEEQAPGRREPADDQCGRKLKALFNKAQVSMFTMTKIINKHLK